MATQADGEGSLSLKKQDRPPLLICILKLMTWVGSLVAQQPLASFDLTGRRKKKVAMPLKGGGEAILLPWRRIIFVCVQCTHPHYRIPSGNAACLLQHGPVL